METLSSPDNYSSNLVGLVFCQKGALTCVFMSDVNHFKVTVSLVLTGSHLLNDSIHFLRDTAGHRKLLFDGIDTTDSPQASDLGAGIMFTKVTVNCILSWIYVIPPATKYGSRLICIQLACVIYHVHGGGVPGLGGCLVRGGAWYLGGAWSQGGCLVARGGLVDDRIPASPEMATAAGGTHPTGMHSC